MKEQNFHTKNYNKTKTITFRLLFKIYSVDLAGWFESSEYKKVCIINGIFLTEKIQGLKNKLSHSLEKKYTPLSY